MALTDILLDESETRGPVMELAAGAGLLDVLTGAAKREDLLVMEIRPRPGGVFGSLVIQSREE